MSFEKYGIFEKPIKEALVAHRKISIPQKTEKIDLINKRIRALEEQLMNKTLAAQAIIEMQEELTSLREGKITEGMIDKLEATSADTSAQNENYNHEEIPGSTVPPPISYLEKPHP